MPVSEKMKETLPQLTLANLGEMNQGRIATRFAQLVNDACRNIALFPCKDGKPEPRDITIKVQLVPVVKTVVKPMETGAGTREVEVPELHSITTRVGVFEKFPKWESATVNLAIEVRNNTIVDVRFNPNNDLNPEQLDLFDDDDSEGV